MKIKIENTYNTIREKNSIKELEILAKKHVEDIKEKLKDGGWTVSEGFFYDVDWEYMERGKDVRFQFHATKYGRGGVTARQLYGICNDICLSACYFTNK